MLVKIWRERCQMYSRGGVTIHKVLCVADKVQG